MTITAKDVIPNEFLTDLGTDWVGANAQGVIIARAGNQETVLKAGDPGEIVAAFSAEHLSHLLLPPAASTEPDPANEVTTADTPPSDVEPAPVKKATKKKP